MLSLIIPIYKNEANIPSLLDAIADLQSRLGTPFEAVFVVDGSPDESLMRLRESLPQQPYAAQLLALSRNFGAFAAMRAGLAAGNGDVLCGYGRRPSGTPRAGAGNAQRPGPRRTATWPMANG